MQHIFITGGTGFFGKSILDYRLRHPEFLSDAELTILSRNPGAFIAANPTIANQHGVSFVQGDVRSFNASAFQRFNFSTIIHAATPAVTTLSDSEMSSTIVDGTRHVLELAKFCGTKRLLFTSSGAVYGPQTAAAGEVMPPNPETAYGRGKLVAERLCIGSGIPTFIARCFAFTGPYLNRRIHFAIGNFIQNCLDGKDIIIKGDGTPLRSYLYADDLVEWLFTILERGEPGRPYNVGSPEGHSIRQIAEMVRSALGTKNEIIVQGKPNPNQSPSVYVPITARAETELNLRVTVPLADAIRKSVGD